jgi:hypothetical protein
MKTAQNRAVETWQWALVIKPLAFFVFAGLVLYPIRRAAMRWLPDGKLKRLLLFRVSETQSYRRK